MGKLLCFLGAICTLAIVTAAGFMFILYRLPVPCDCDLEDRMPESNLNDWRLAATEDFEDLLFFGGYLYYQFPDEPAKMYPPYMVLRLNSLEHRRNNDDETDHLLLHTNCALINMKLMVFEDMTVVSRINLNLTRPNGNEYLCEISELEIINDQNQHYRCYEKRLYPCHSLKDPTKVVVNLVLDALEFELEGDVSRHKIGAFSREAKNCHWKSSSSSSSR